LRWRILERFSIASRPSAFNFLCTFLPASHDFGFSQHLVASLTDHIHVFRPHTTKTAMSAATPTPQDSGLPAPPSIQSSKLSEVETASNSSKPTILHLGDDIRWNHELYVELQKKFNIIRTYSMGREDFKQALKGKKWGDFVGMYRPFWNTGGEMGNWDKELMYVLFSSLTSIILRKIELFQISNDSRIVNYCPNPAASTPPPAQASTGSIRASSLPTTSSTATRPPHVPSPSLTQPLCSFCLATAPSRGPS
jgi:hypothetical protein